MNKKYGRFRDVHRIDLFYFFCASFCQIFKTRICNRWNFSSFTCEETTVWVAI